MEDERVWAFEESLWTGDADHYRELVDLECLMVVPEKPFILQGEEAISAVSSTPRWSEVEITQGRIMRPQEGLIVIAYQVVARREGGSDYAVHCTSTYRRLGPETWRVIQHQQTPTLTTANR
jgi:hypothetical protein